MRMATRRLDRGVLTRVRPAGHVGFGELAERSHNARMRFDLERFVVAQSTTYAGALAELRAGRKIGHWIWFVFPQIEGLGLSQMSRRYAIASLDEARAYLAHSVLGGRLRECATALLAIPGSTADEVLGALDAIKVRSSMTLFHRAAPGEPLFAQVLERYYGGAPDAATDERLG
jgi:uncharacterized protein (DUF1810 family)